MRRWRRLRLLAARSRTRRSSAAPGLVEALHATFSELLARRHAILARGDGMLRTLAAEWLAQIDEAQRAATIALETGSYDLCVRALSDLETSLDEVDLVARAICNERAVRVEWTAWKFRDGLDALDGIPTIRILDRLLTRGRQLLEEGRSRAALRLTASAAGEILRLRAPLDLTTPARLHRKLQGELSQSIPEAGRRAVCSALDAGHHELARRVLDDLETANSSAKPERVPPAPSALDERTLELLNERACAILAGVGELATTAKTGANR